MNVINSCSFIVCLTDTRQALAALPRQTGKDKSHALSDLLTQTSNAILDQIKTVLNYLKVTSHCLLTNSS